MQQNIRGEKDAPKNPKLATLGKIVRASEDSESSLDSSPSDFNQNSDTSTGSHPPGGTMR